jgi:hypothetical protein
LSGFLGSAATGQIAQLNRQPLADLLRDRIEGDDELRELRDDARRRRLRLAVVQLPSPLSPAAFTQATLCECPPAPQWTVGVSDPWATWLQARIRRRLSEILASVFGDLRAGRFEGTGFVPGSVSRTVAPAELWASPSVVLDIRANALLAGPTVLFAGVEVQSPSQRPRSASRSALDTFVVSFDAAILAVGRRYSIGELVTTTRQHLGAGVSAREVEAALQRASPAAWSGSGRRPACAVPTEAELAQAARLAAENSA